MVIILYFKQCSYNTIVEMAPEQSPTNIERLSHFSSVLPLYFIYNCKFEKVKCCSTASIPIIGLPVSSVFAAIYQWKLFLNGIITLKCSKIFLNPVLRLLKLLSKTIL